jgi:hypothetical protein
MKSKVLCGIIILLGVMCAFLIGLVFGSLQSNHVNSAPTEAVDSTPKSLWENSELKIK